MFGWKNKALVPVAGLEPASLAAADFESAASTSSATRAQCPSDSLSRIGQSSTCHALTRKYPYHKIALSVGQATV